MKSLLLGVPLLALCPQTPAQQLIACDSSRVLYSIDAATGAKTQIGTITSNASTTAGLAVDPATGTVYLTSTGNDSLYTLDLATGTATLVGFYGSTSFVMHGLEWDSSTGTLYGVSSHDNGLYRIDTATGFPTLIGTSGLTSFTNLGYDPVNDVMWATNSNADSFYVMDRTTGGMTLIGPLNGPTNPNGLAFDATTQTLYMVDNSQDNLYTIDTATGVATVVGPTGSGNLLGLVCIGCSGSSWRTFGAGCAGSAGVPQLGSSEVPVTGQTFTTQITNLPPAAAPFGTIGFSNTLLAGAPLLPLDLGLLGMPGCNMYIDVALSVGLNPIGGVATLSLALPPSALGLTFYQQGFVLDPPANPFGLTVTNGGAAFVGQ